MDINELKLALERIENLFVAGGASAAAKDIRSVAHLLNGYDGKSVDTFIAETRQLLEKSASLANSSVDLERVVIHTDRMMGAGIDQTAFDAALRQLDSDGLVGKSEWAAIATRYRNAPTNGTHVYKFKSIKEARAAIRDTFIERHEASSKRGILDRITKWAS
jgi:hypothetical protein